MQTETIHTRTETIACVRTGNIYVHGGLSQSQYVWIEVLRDSDLPMASNANPHSLGVPVLLERSAVILTECYN